MNDDDLIPKERARVGGGGGCGRGRVVLSKTLVGSTMVLPGFWCTGTVQN